MHYNLHLGTRLSKLTLLTTFAPNQAELVPYGGGMTFIPSDMDGGKSLYSSFSNLSEIKQL